MIKNKDAYMKPFTFVVNNNMSKQVDRIFGDRVSSREVLEKNKIKYTIPYDGDLEWFINRYNIKGQLVEKIVKKSDGYYVQSEKGKNLGGPYKKREDAEKRLDQVEYFKNRKKMDEEDTSKQATGNKRSKRDIVGLAKQNGFEGIVNAKELTVHHIDDSENEDGLEDNSYKNLWFIKSENWKDRELLHKVLHFMDRNNVSYDALLNRLEDIKLYQYDEATNGFKEKTLSVFKESLKHNERGMNEDMTNDYRLTRADVFGKFKRKVDEFYKHAFEVGTDEAWKKFYKDVDKMAAFYNKKIEEHNKEFRNSPNHIRIANEWDLIDPKYFLSHYDMMGESLKESEDKQYYVMTHSKDRVGNKSRRYRVVDASSKADVRRKLNGGFYGTIDAILTKEEALSKFGEDNFKKLWNINLVDESLTEDGRSSTDDDFVDNETLDKLRVWEVNHLPKGYKFVDLNSARKVDTYSDNDRMYDLIIATVSYLTDKRDGQRMNHISQHTYKVFDDGEIKIVPHGSLYDESLTEDTLKLSGKMKTIDVMPSFEKWLEDHGQDPEAVKGNRRLYDFYRKKYEKEDRELVKSNNESGKRGKVMVNESLIADKIEDMASADDVKVALEAEYANYPHVLEGLLEWIGDGEDFEEYKENLVNLLNEIEYLESTDQMDALEMATEDQGSSYFEDTVDIINRGDFLFFPGVEDDEELGHAFVDMCGGISAAVSRDRLATYIDIDEVAETFKEGTEDDSDLADMDDDAWYSLAEEQVEMSPESYEDYFDYDRYGRDLRMEGGYFFGDLGAIAIL